VTGRIAVFWQHKHFGFIAEGKTTNEIFFHQNNLAPDSPPPEKGSSVTYDVGEYNGRRVADNVRVLRTGQLPPGGVA
jgi:cold shock CspA family protein